MSYEHHEGSKVIAFKDEESYLRHRLQYIERYNPSYSFLNFMELLYEHDHNVIESIEDIESPVPWAAMSPYIPLHVSGTDSIIGYATTAASDNGTVNVSIPAGSLYYASDTNTIGTAGTNGWFDISSGTSTTNNSFNDSSFWINNFSNSTETEEQMQQRFEKEQERIENNKFNRFDIMDLE